MIVLIDLNSVEFYQSFIKADLTDKRLSITFTCNAHAAEEDSLNLLHITGDYDCNSEKE